MKNREKIKQQIFEMLAGLSVREARALLNEVIYNLDNVTLGFIKL